MSTRCSNMFIVDHFVSEGVIKEFLGLQGMANVSFRQQQSKPRYICRMADRSQQYR